ncbi:hypothetical protein YK48G_06280 [Lentilactobacillus fungorum]|uniref:Uncharacterized protein n=1 Tax=Lentilactobacillus fungorum TaxID=2201250 RepID=A0ABQ3VWC7_9LACO|nr:hypothetical protein [Lentilactobacillus fungorum]GHP13203.1 hypothetical protein YK48G_06280 [Lentilactobacillus fungorum]
MNDYKKRLLNDATLTVPICGLIVSLLAIIYFVLYEGQNSLAAIVYTLIPLVGGVLIATPFWIIKHRLR